MSKFSISDNAAKVIRKLFQDSGIARPVGQIGGSSRPLIASQKFRDTLDEGATNEDRVVAGEAEFKKNNEPIRLSMKVFVLDVGDIADEDLVVVDGISMCMPESLRNALSAHVLDHNDIGFFLRQKGMPTPDATWNYSRT